MLNRRSSFIICIRYDFCFFCLSISLSLSAYVPRRSYWVRSVLEKIYKINLAKKFKRNTIIINI